MLGDVMLRSLMHAEERLDDEIERLDRLEDDDLERMRRERMDQLKAAQRARTEWTAAGHGTYSEMSDEKDFFKQLKASKRAVVHFYRGSNRACAAVDAHLARLAPKHVETRFVKVNAEKAPFLVERLKIWMLPTMVLIKDGRTDHSIVGLDELGGSEDFTTETLEEVLLGHGLLLETFCG